MQVVQWVLLFWTTITNTGNFKYVWHQKDKKYKETIKVISQTQGRQHNQLCVIICSNKSHHQSTEIHSEIQTVHSNKFVWHWRDLFKRKRGTIIAFFSDVVLLKLVGCCLWIIVYTQSLTKYSSPNAKLRTSWVSFIIITRA